MQVMKQALISAAIDYINKTHLGYSVEFDIDESVDVAFAHMNFLKECNCGCIVTKNNAVKYSINEMGEWFNCPKCRTTLFKRKK